MTHVTEDTLPDDVELVRTTAWFDQDSVPAGLLRRHTTKAGTWGVLIVDAGALTFRFLAPAIESRRVGAPGRVVIAPTRPHELALDGPVRFCVEFWRRP